MAVLKDFNSYLAAQKNLVGANAGTLGTSFAEALKQIGPQLNVLKANFDNLMINAGKLLLPAVSDILKWVGGFAKAINSNPLLKDLLGAGAGLAFGVAVASKIKGALNTVMGLFGKSAQTVSLNANTAALEANTLALGGKNVPLPNTPLKTGLDLVKTAAKFVPATAAAIAATALLQYAGSQGPTYAQQTTAQRLQGRSPMPTGAAKKTTTVKVKVTK